MQLQNPVQSPPLAKAVEFHAPRKSRAPGTTAIGISLALHLLLLFLPKAYEKQVKKPEPKPTKITKISTITPIRLTKSKLVAKPKRSVPAQRPRSTPLQLPIIVRTQNPANPPTTPNPEPTPTSPAPPVSPSTPKPAPFAFTPYPGAESGCLSLRSCFSTSDTVEQVSGFFARQLVTDGYAATLEIDEPNRKVFRFSKDGKNRYLSILNVEVSTVYAAADSPKTYADLQSAVEIPPEFEDLLTQVTGQSASNLTGTAFMNQLSDPALFFSQLNPAEIRPEISGEPFLIPGKMPQQVFNEFFQTRLPNIGLPVFDEPEGEYGGGPVYRIQADRSKPFFLNLIPNRDHSGSIIIVWLALPPL